MKNKLQSLIRRAINEVLKESTVPATVSYKGNLPDKVLKVDPADAETIQNIKTDPNIDHATVGTKKLKETELNEMAGANYKLADDYEEKMSNLPAELTGSAKRMVWINGIIDHMNEVGSDTITHTAEEKFNLPQARIADYARAMIKAGVLEPAVAGFVPKFMQPEDEEGGDEEPIKGGDAMAIGNVENPLAQYFDGKPNADGSEDFTPETEPELPAVAEPFKAIGPVAKAAEFTIDNDRLIKKIIDLHGASKIRVKEVVGDSELSGSDFARAEKGRKETATSRLPELIQQLADKISMEDEETQTAILAILAKKFASVNYSSLSKKVAAALGTVVPQVKEPEMDDLGLEDDEEEIDQLDEYAKRKLQFYAGIIK
jgi:hypothetical protein